MGIQAEHNPYGSGPLLVRKVLGNAYDVVKCVYEHLNFIKAVANNMSFVVASANNVHRNIVVLTGTTDDAGETVTIMLPTGITPAKVLDFNVLIEGTDDALYSADGGFFSSHILNDRLYLTLDDEAPSVLENAQIRWVLSYES